MSIWMTRLIDSESPLSTIHLSSLLSQHYQQEDLTLWRSEQEDFSELTISFCYQLKTLYILFLLVYISVCWIVTTIPSVSLPFHKSVPVAVFVRRVPSMKVMSPCSNFFCKLQPRWHPMHHRIMIYSFFMRSAMTCRGQIGLYVFAPLEPKNTVALKNSQHPYENSVIFVQVPFQHSAIWRQCHDLPVFPFVPATARNSAFHSLGTNVDPSGCDLSVGGVAALG